MSNVMDDRTLTALKGSIAKWTAIAAGTVEDEGSDNCPLCAEFYDHPKGDCFGCPVKQATGRSWCFGSPYCESWIPLSNEYNTSFAINDEMKASALAELAFLRSLLTAEGEDRP